MDYSIFTQQEIEDFYMLRFGGCYKKLIEPKGWLACKQCGCLPHVWIYNYGRYATCMCFNLYDVKPARAECVMSVNKRCNGSMEEYSYYALKQAWNKYVETGEPQNQLEDGKF